MNEITVTVTPQEISGQGFSMSSTSKLRVSSHPNRDDLIQLTFEDQWFAVFPEDLIAAVRAIQRGQDSVSE